MRNDLKGAEESAKKSVEEAENTSDPLTRADANSSLADILRSAGKLEEAEGAARRAVNEAEKTSYSRARSDANKTLANILLMMGDLKAAEETARKAVKEAEKTDNLVTCTYSYFCMAQVLQIMENKRKEALKHWELGVEYTLRLRRIAAESAMEESAFAMHRRNIAVAASCMEQIAASYAESGQQGEALDAYVRAFLCAEALRGRHILEDLDHYSKETSVNFETRNVLWNRLPPPGRFGTELDDLGTESCRWSASLLCLGTTTRSDETTDQAHVEPSKRGLGETGKLVDEMLVRMPSQEEIVSALPLGAVAILFAPSGNDLSIYAVRRGEDGALELIGEKPLRLEGVMRPLDDKLNELHERVQDQFWVKEIESVRSASKEKGSSGSERLLKAYLRSLEEDMNRLGESLYESLGLAELPDEVWKGSDLVLIPEGLLYHVPWSLLRDKDTGEYLCENFESVSVISNLRLLNLCEQFINASPNGDPSSSLRTLIFSAPDPGEGRPKKNREEMKKTSDRLASGVAEDLGRDNVRHVWAAGEGEAVSSREAKWKDFLEYHYAPADVLLFYLHGNPGQMPWADQSVGKEKVLGSPCNLVGKHLVLVCTCCGGSPDTGQEIRSLATAFLCKGSGCAMYGIYNLPAKATATLMRVWIEKLREALEKNIPFPRARSFKQALEEVRRKAMQTSDPDGLESFLSHPILFAPLFIFGRG